MNPRVSVIIPHFERAALLQHAIDSVFASGERDFEIIIVDDGSSEDVWREICRFQGPQVRVLRRKDGVKGPSRCRNLGLAEARADYIIFLDSDDAMAPWCLEQRLKAAEQFPQADFWVFPILLFREIPGDQNFLWNEMSNGTDDALRFARSDPPWQTSSPLWRKAALQKIGGFNENVFYGDDGDLHLRALVSGLVARQFPTVLPDVFIRRSEAPRITNSPGPTLLASRRTRLREVTQFLRTCPSGARFLPVWEGQYFVEAEFLLFTLRDGRTAISAVLDDWVKSFAPPVLRQWFVRSYFAFALRCRYRAYFFLRVARRIAMKLLPAEFFPRGGKFHSAEAPPAIMTEVTARMASPAHAIR